MSLTFQWQCNHIINKYRFPFVLENQLFSYCRQFGHAGHEIVKIYDVEQFRRRITGHEIHASPLWSVEEKERIGMGHIGRNETSFRDLMDHPLVAIIPWDPSKKRLIQMLLILESNVCLDSRTITWFHILLYVLETGLWMLLFKMVTPSKKYFYQKWEDMESEMHGQFQTGRDKLVTVIS